MSKEKSWEEFTPEERTSLLNHWFYYYGGVVLTLKDFADFRTISTTRQDEIFDHIVTSFIFQNTIQSNVLVACLRQQKLDELFSHSLTRAMIQESALEQYEAARRMISSEILNTLINPEPPVPMDINILIKDDNQPKRQ